jgi:imidazolonepropionase-like amidohydrolase
MITSVGGYPTQSWGSNGYGLEVTSVDEARAAVGSLAQAGARVIKVPLDGDNSPSDDQVRAVTEAAHQLDLKVAAHALTLAGVERMVTLGCDILAHAPTENLPDATVAAFGRRAVVSTLGAFGAARTAKDNLARLHAAGATVLYGTDFGNSRIVGIDVQELALLEEIGLTRDEVLDAATTLPADYWGITEGTFNLGGDASFLLLTGDPREDFSVLSSPVYTFFRGQMLRGPSDD